MLISYQKATWITLTTAWNLQAEHKPIKTTAENNGGK